VRQEKSVETELFAADRDGPDVPRADRHWGRSERTGVVIGEQKKVVGEGFQESSGLLTERRVADDSVKAGAVHRHGRESGPTQVRVELRSGLLGAGRPWVEDDDVDRFQQCLTVDVLSAEGRDLPVGLQ
jgi:hypothetical protein